MVSQFPESRNQFLAPSLGPVTTLPPQCPLSAGPKSAPLHVKRESPTSHGCQEYHPFSIGLTLPPLTVGISRL